MITLNKCLLVLIFIIGMHVESSVAAEIPADLKALHVLNRLGFGPRPGDIKRVNAMGIDAYISQQLSPDTIPESDRVTRAMGMLKTYDLTPEQLLDQYGVPKKKGKKRDRAFIKQQRQKARLILEEASNARLLRAIESPRQLQEVLVDFWYNHFNVYHKKGNAALWVGAYEREAIRPYVLGHFRNMLKATARHPAMLFYLDNWKNVKPIKRRGLNENYARELMELHTLGVNGGYTQEDVIVLARILTGRGLFDFNPRWHDNSDKIFLGHAIRGNGNAEIEGVLDILARSSATARYISFKLAQYFVADVPDSGLVGNMAREFESTDGDIRAVLKLMFESPQFWDMANDGNKFKTPYQYLISAVRASGKDVTHYQPLIGLLTQLGMPLYGSLTPDGYKNTQEAWLNSDGMLRRINFATVFGSGTLKLSDDPAPIVYQDVMETLGNHLSLTTMEAVNKAPAGLRVSLILGSQEMMKK